MGLFKGSFSGERFVVVGEPRVGFGEADLEVLEREAVGKGGIKKDDGLEVGFTAGAHLFDLRFTYEKNLIEDCLTAAIRIDTNRPPAALVRAYTELELAAITADDPDSAPTKKQKKEAKEAALARCEDEAKTGKYRRSKTTSFLWDAQQGLVWLAASSNAVIEQFRALFESAFEVELQRLTVSKIAEDGAAEAEVVGDLADVQPLLYHPGGQEVADFPWMKDDFNRHGFLGNEFLLWLCWRSEIHEDTAKLPDGAEAAWMVERNLVLECPLGLSGREAISADSPLRLPEARLALRTGKLPRKAGLTLSRDDQVFKLGLQGELFSIGTAHFPTDEDDDGEDERLVRIRGMRDLHTTLQDLFREFLHKRLSDAWRSDAERMRNWLAVEEAPIKVERPRGKRGAA